MIGNFVFVLKALLMTAGFVFVMQLQFSGRSLEEHSLEFIKGSQATLFFREVADGGVAMIEQLLGNFSGKVPGKIQASLKDEGLPGKRILKFQLKRSQEFAQKQLDKLQEKLKEETKND